MSLRLLPLGTNGFFPTFGRQTMSFLLLGESDALLLDAGSGVARLAEGPVAEKLAPYDRLDVLLTHYHLDHVVGLSYLTALWSHPVRLFAPGTPLVETEAEEALGRLLRPPLFPLTLDRFPMEVELRPYAGKVLEIGPWELALCSQTHPGGSVGVRLADSLAYVTDTTAEESKADFVRGVDLLMHEVWVTDEEAERDPRVLSGHSSVSGVAGIARAAGVGRLAPVHHHPRRPPGPLREMVGELATRCGVEVVLLEEGRTYEIRAPGGR